MSECRIAFVGKSRNGGDRYWCMEHHAPAYGKNGARLAQCLAVSKDGAWDKLSREPDSQRSAGRIFRRRMIRPFIRRKAAGNMTGRRVPFIWRGGRSACAGRNLQGCGDRRDPCKGRLGPAVHGRENPSLFKWKNSGPALSGLWRAARGYAGLCGGKRRALCREKGLCAVLCPQMRKVRAEL